MRKLASLLLLSAFLAFFVQLHSASAQVGKSISALVITDPENQAKALPFVGEKVLMILYTDPDVKDVNDVLSEAVKAKHFDPSKYAGIGIANCKDTWIPNSGIRMKARQKEKQFPGSVIMLDENYILSSAWGLGDCNSTGVEVIVGKDKSIKYVKKVKAEEESKAIVAEVIKVLENELDKL